MSAHPEIAAFEAGDIDPADFDHAAHVYIGWSYRQSHGLPETTGC